MTKTKRCFRCRRKKPLSEYSLTRGRPNAWCRACHRAYNADYFRNDPGRYRRIRLERQYLLRLFVAKLKHGRECPDCGLAMPYFILEFDHVRGKRSFRIGSMQTRMLSLERVIAEIAKCDVVCANCHRRRTFIRKAIAGGGTAGKRILRTANAVLRAFKRRSRCMDCGVRYPYFVLDLDHLRDKRAALSRLVNASISMDRLRGEIEKCETVCANCHRLRTTMRRFERKDPTLLQLWAEIGIDIVGLEWVVR